MSIDKAFRDVIREEIKQYIAPIVSKVEALEKSHGNVFDRIKQAFAEGPGRAVVKSIKPGKSPAVRAAPAKASAAKDAKEGADICALIGCGRPARSKGYCAAHYQKYRMLQKTNRLPPEWVEYAKAGTVQNITLPRGRAGAKALAEKKR
jgi:hypothetical protein